jgi:hypothetical protein
MYKLIKFDEKAGQLYVLFTATGGTITIDLPVENGLYIIGDALDSYIKGFIPDWVLQRKQLIDSGIPNSDAIASLIYTPTEEEQLLEMAIAARKRRDKALNDCDWCLLPDSGFNKEVIDDLLVYRQKLRDVPQQPKFPHEIDWPTSNTWELWEKQKRMQGA